MNFFFFYEKISLKMYCFVSQPLGWNKNKGKKILLLITNKQIWDLELIKLFLTFMIKMLEIFIMVCSVGVHGLQ